MADEEVAVDEELDGEESGSKSGMKKIIFMVVGMLVIAGISVVATLFLTGGNDGPSEADQAEMAAEEMMAEEQVVTPEAGMAIYMALKPEFIINYPAGSRQRFLQTELSVLARDQLVVDTITTHMPLIRNNILETLSQQEFSNLRTHEGRVALSEEIASTIQDTLITIMGRPGVEKVLYRSFIMQ